MSLIVIKPASIDSTQLQYAVLDKDTPEASFRLGDWEHVKRALRKRKLILLIPSEDVLLLPANIPSRNKKQLKQAIPFAIEDRLADEVDDLHFSFHATDELVHIAVIQKLRLNQWIELAKQHGLTLHAMLPDVLALPITEQGWTLQEQETALGQSRLLVRKHKVDGFVCPLNMAETLLSHDLNDETTIQRMTLDCNEMFERVMTAHTPTGVELQNRPLDLNIDDLLAALPLNLLVGAKQDNSSPVEWKQWRVAAAISFMTLSTWLGFIAYESNQLKQRIAQQDQAIERIYKTAFPKEKRVVDARVQMEQKLKALQGSTQLRSNTTPFPLLASIAPKLSTNISVNNISFNQSQGLKLSLDASSLNDLDQLENTLKQDASFNTNLETSIVSGNAQGKLTLKPN